MTRTTWDSPDEYTIVPDQTGGTGPQVRPPEDRVRTIPINRSLEGRGSSRKEPRPFEDLPPEIRDLVISRRKARSGSKSLLEVLEGKHVLSLILYLDRMSPVLKTDVYSDVSRSAGMAGKLDDLERMGLITIYRTARTVSNVIVMTDKGRETAEKLRELLAILEG